MKRCYPFFKKIPPHDVTNFEHITLLLFVFPKKHSTALKMTSNWSEDSSALIILFFTFKIILIKCASIRKILKSKRVGIKNN